MQLVDREIVQGRLAWPHRQLCIDMLEARGDFCTCDPHMLVCPGDPEDEGHGPHIAQIEHQSTCKLTQSHLARFN